MFKDLTPTEVQLLTETLFPNGLSMTVNSEKIRLLAKKSICVLIKNSNGELVNDNDILYIHKVFGTKGLNLNTDDYAVLDATPLSGKEIIDIIKSNNIKMVFCFNINPQLIKVNTIAAYLPFIQNNITYIFAHSIETFQQNKDHRRDMLTTLQKLFM